MDAHPANANDGRNCPGDKKLVSDGAQPNALSGACRTRLAGELNELLMVGSCAETHRSSTIWARAPVPFDLGQTILAKNRRR
jgi:hypothetical protein